MKSNSFIITHYEGNIINFLKRHHLKVQQIRPNNIRGFINVRIDIAAKHKLQVLLLLNKENLCYDLSFKSFGYNYHQFINMVLSHVVVKIEHFVVYRAHLS